MTSCICLRRWHQIKVVIQNELLFFILEKYDGKDLSDLDNIKDLNINREDVIDENL